MPSHLGRKLLTKAAILHATKQLFEEGGISHVSFDIIAEKAGVSRTTVFNHFSTMAQLFEALQMAELDEILIQCENSKLIGINKIWELFDKLIDDTACYPHMMTFLTDNLILSDNAKAVCKMEFLVSKILKEIKLSDDVQFTKDELVVIIFGQYYGMVNHYHIQDLPFNAREMKMKFKEIIGKIMKL